MSAHPLRDDRDALRVLRFFCLCALTQVLVMIIIAFTHPTPSIAKQYLDESFDQDTFLWDARTYTTPDRHL